MQELESTEEDEEQMARLEHQQQQEDEERCRRWDELTQPRTPQPTGLGMTTHHFPSKTTKNQLAYHNRAHLTQ
jgi:hypothetical protein